LKTASSKKDLLSFARKTAEFSAHPLIKIDVKIRSINKYFILSPYVARCFSRRYDNQIPTIYQLICIFNSLPQNRPIQLSFSGRSLLLLNPTITAFVANPVSSAMVIFQFRGGAAKLICHPCRQANFPVWLQSSPR
jgi:hypothetical protein